MGSSQLDCFVVFFQILKLLSHHAFDVDIAV